MNTYSERLFHRIASLLPPLQEEIRTDCTVTSYLQTAV